MAVLSTWTIAASQPSPAGLPGLTQLDRIEEKLDEVQRRLSSGLLQRSEPSVADGAAPLAPAQSSLLPSPVPDDMSLQQTHQDAMREELNIEVSRQAFADLGNQIIWQFTFSRNRTRYIQFYFDHVHHASNTDFRVRIIDNAGLEVATYDAVQFSKKSEFLTGLLPPGTLKIQLLANGQTPELDFRLATAAWQDRPQKARAQTAVIKVHFLKEYPDGSPFAAIAQSVALLHIGAVETACTGVLISSDVVATNYHCIRSSLAFLRSETSPTIECDDVLAEFDYLTADSRGSTARCASVRVDKDLDIAFLHFRQEDLRTKSGQLREPVKTRPVTDGIPSQVSLVHHPMGLPVAAESNCSVGPSQGTDILHDCISTSGSSGSPLFDEQLRWVGLHYRGAYPSNWTVEMMENDFLDNGTRYNRARKSVLVLGALHP